MTEGVAAAPRERGWLLVLVGLAAFSLPLIPLPVVLPVRAVLPVVETVVLFVPALAACFVLGWLGGGSAWLAALWVGMAMLAFRAAVPAEGAYADVARGWALVLAAAFGVVSIAAPRQRLFARALGSCAFALLMAFLFLLLADKTPEQAATVFGDEFARRNVLLAQITDLQSATVRSLSREMPFLGALLDRQFFDGLLQRSVGATQLFAPLYPAMLMLESLAALTLAWAVYHRLNRARLGPPLAPLRDFRFSDQLVWGFVAGLVMVVVPGLSALDALGRNLLVLFGGLYLVRGVGVLAWFIMRLPRGRFIATMAAVGAALLFSGSSMVPALGAVFGSVAIVPPLVLGLSDSWVDWRSRAPSA
ncbi:MAG TPA: DUF2232 domain-containing protein [Gemmatimonadaceae bacterium]|nr:DUF2232 domain-containing protein [Gemmatimonadaceae bacterium]